MVRMKKAIGMPAFQPPLAAVAVKALPEGEDWIYELKLDGYRALILKDGDRVQVRSRNDKDLAYPSVIAAARRLQALQAVVDGEIVAVDEQGRPQNPRCFHGLPYPGFFVGVLCEEIPRPSWLDLRSLEDFDRRKLNERLNSGVIELVHTMPRDMLLEALDCAARADDTTIRQERSMRDQLSALRQQ